MLDGRIGRYHITLAFDDGDDALSSPGPAINMMKQKRASCRRIAITYVNRQP